MKHAKGFTAYAQMDGLRRHRPTLVEVIDGLPCCLECSYPVAGWTEEKGDSMTVKLTALDKQTLKTAIESGGWITETRYPDRHFFGKRYEVNKAKIRPQTFRRLRDAGLLKQNGNEGPYYFYQVTNEARSG